jgi:hypothetical protein
LVWSKHSIDTKAVRLLAGLEGFHPMSAVFVPNNKYQKVMWSPKKNLREWLNYPASYVITFTVQLDVESVLLNTHINTRLALFIGNLYVES